jgi:(p)ppGpp synthase/HD superfamily hydrolase
MNDAGLGVNYGVMLHDTMLVSDPREKRLIEFVFKAHAGQVDKVGAPYHRHLYRVARTVDPRLALVAYAHDILEDTKTTQADLYHVGFNPYEVNIITALTHRPNERNVDYLVRVKDHPDAVRIKVADLMDNISRNRMEGLDLATRDRLYSKYYTALLVLTDLEV